MNGHPGNRYLLFIPLIAILCAQILGQGAPATDAFFLDLGIVIEPTKGDEEVNRLIKAPPEKVSFLLDKAPSGSVFIASTKELQETLQRISERIGTLEQAFHKEMTGLREENHELRDMVSDLLAREPIIPSTPLAVAAPSEGESEAIQPTVPGMEPPESVEVESLEQETSLPVEVSTLKEQIPFNKMVYMNAVFAYQREDYGTALLHFSRLSLSEVDQVTAGNILYWIADCYYQYGKYERSLETLMKIGTLFSSDKQDDAMVLTGLVYRKMGDETLALQAFGEIIDMYPDSEYFNLAQMELRKSR